MTTYNTLIKEHNKNKDDIVGINSQLAEKANKNEIGTPLIASSISGMTDKTKVYVNTTDGNWYSWNGTVWTKGGLYNSQGIGDGAITSDKTNFFEKINLFNPNNIIDGKFINSDIETLSDGYYHSDFIAVEPGGTYIIPYNVNNLGCYYDVNKQYVGNLKRTDLSQSSTECSLFKIGLATYYVKINGYKGNYEGRTSRQPTEYMMIKGTIYPNEHIYFNNNKAFLNSESMNKNVIRDIAKSEIAKSEIKNSTANILEGKILACVGDSITEGVNADIDTETGARKTYGYLVAKRNNMTFLNYGIGGSTIANDGSSKAFVYNRYSVMENNIDYLTVWFGWNDFARENVTLGTIDSTDKTTFYGAWNFTMEYLINKYPTTKIGLVVPYGTDVNWRNAVRNIGKKWGIPYLDLMSEHTPLFFDKEPEIGVNASVVEKRKATFLADVVHPNQVGYNYLSTIFEDFIRSL